MSRQYLVSGEEGLMNALNRSFKKNGLIPFHEVSRILSYWRIRKYQRDELLHALEKSGKIRIVNYEGIILQKGGKLK